MTSNLDVKVTIFERQITRAAHADKSSQVRYLSKYYTQHYNVSWGVFGKQEVCKRLASTPFCWQLLIPNCLCNVASFHLSIFIAF